VKTLVKICGITNKADALLAVELGADAIGFVFYKASKRFVTPDYAKEIISCLPPFVVKCGVFVHENRERILEIKDYCSIDRVQVYYDDTNLCGKLVPSVTIMAFRIRDKEDLKKAEVSEYFPLFDSYNEKMYGGSGTKFNWDVLKDFNRPFILAGGINASNIDEVLKLNPYAIDIASGVESVPGRKDPEKMAEIFEKIKGSR